MTTSVIFMFEEVNHKANEKFEESHNLIGFFDLLLRVDRRNNPGRYRQVKTNTNYETIAGSGNEIKNLLDKGDVLDRFGRTPKSTTNLLRGMDSLGSSPEAITVFKPDTESITGKTANVNYRSKNLKSNRLKK